MSRLPLFFVAASLGALFAACDLNPQPLPPGDDEPTGAPAPGPADKTGSSGGFEGDDPTTPNASAEAGSADGGHDASDAAADADSGPN